MKKILFSLPLFMVIVLPVWSQSTFEDVGMEALYHQRIQYLQDSIEANMYYQYGEIILGNGLAVFEVPKGYKYLSPGQSRYVMTELWGNPPAQTLGLLFPANSGVFDTENYVIEISFAPLGYVDDRDVVDVNLSSLLGRMKADIPRLNNSRKAGGYKTYKIIDWASAPSYDIKNKKLYWAQEGYFEGNDETTLNYNIKILGRRGVLALSFISKMGHFKKVEKDIPLILSSIGFAPGHQYHEFDPRVDRIAPIGIDDLIIGEINAEDSLPRSLAKHGKYILLGSVLVFLIFRLFFSIN